MAHPKDIINTNENGKLHGLFEQHYTNGRLKLRATYKNGEIHGSYEKYFLSGNLWVKANFKDGKIHGAYEIYYVNGRLKSKKFYDMGREIDHEVKLNIETNHMFEIY